MSLTEVSLNIPAEHTANVFGQFDAYIKKIERTLNVTVVLRGESMKILGEESKIKKASNVFLQLIELSKRGNVITEQNVNYALALMEEEKESAIVEIDKDCICHTVGGKPGKAENLRTEGLCGCYPQQDDRLWHGTCRYRQDLSWRWQWRSLRLRMRKWAGSS